MFFTKIYVSQTGLNFSILIVLKFFSRHKWFLSIRHVLPGCHHLLTYCCLFDRILNNKGLYLYCKPYIDLICLTFVFIDNSFIPHTTFPLFFFFFFIIKFSPFLNVLDLWFSKLRFRVSLKEVIPETHKFSPVMIIICFFKAS